LVISFKETLWKKTFDSDYIARYSRNAFSNLLKAGVIFDRSEEEGKIYYMVQDFVKYAYVYDLL